MENYMLLPSQPSSSHHLSSSNNMITNTQVLFGTNFYGNMSGSGLDGLKDAHEGSNSNKGSSHLEGHAASSDHQVEGIGTGDDSDHHVKQGKKKGEKKVRRPRYAFQTRSQVDILDDGYRWRKYGQKAVKNNKFPRSYYRCTHQGCNVKKQVQRLSKDEGVVVTTYEGMHTHAIEKSNDNFEHILNQMQIYSSF